MSSEVLLGITPDPLFLSEMTSEISTHYTENLIFSFFALSPSLGKQVNYILGF